MTSFGEKVERHKVLHLRTKVVRDELRTVLSTASEREAAHYLLMMSRSLSSGRAEAEATLRDEYGWGLPEAEQRAMLSGLSKKRRDDYLSLVNFWTLLGWERMNFIGVSDLFLRLHERALLLGKESTLGESPLRNLSLLLLDYSELTEPGLHCLSSRLLLADEDAVAQVVGEVDAELRITGHTHYQAAIESDVALARRESGYDSLRPPTAKEKQAAKRKRIEESLAELPHRKITQDPRQPYPALVPGLIDLAEIIKRVEAELYADGSNHRQTNFCQIPTDGDLESLLPASGDPFRILEERDALHDLLDSAGLKGNERQVMEAIIHDPALLDTAEIERLARVVSRPKSQVSVEKSRSLRKLQDAAKKAS